MLINEKYFLSTYISDQKRDLFERADKYEITAYEDITELVAKFVGIYTLHPIVLQDPVPSEPSEIAVDRTNDWGKSYKEKAYLINVRIPFEGSSILFDCKPSLSYRVYINNNVRFLNNAIVAPIVLKELDPVSYKVEVDKLISDLSVNLPNIHAEIASWNTSLENVSKDALERRRKISSKKFDFMEKIGLTVNKGAETFITPPVAKKIIPTPVSETSKEVKKAFVPILQDQVYKDIREVLYNVGKAIERKPSIYTDKHEEDLRDIFLLFLETRYESTTGVGEAFNKKGKTDILLKFAKDGTNLFVAECKFWKGQKKLFDGIDQLLGYLTHRDSKTALMLFVDQKDYTSVVDTLKVEIKNHPNFKRHVMDTYDTSINYEFTLPGDPQKVIQMEVILYHFPK